MRCTIKRKLLEIQNLFRPESFILMYHRVTELEIDPWKLAVSAKNFDEQLTVLKNRFNVIPLEELVENMKQKRLQNKSVAITFDDGYKDNYTTAYPILKEHKLPATFFINSGYIKSQNEFWPDKLIRLILNDYRLPEMKLDLKLINRCWVVHKENYDQQARFDFFWKIWHSLLKAHPIIREQTLTQIEEWASHDHYVKPDTYPMTEAELADMANDPLVSIGGHTSNHVALSFLGIEQQREEIVSNKLWLEKTLKKPITGFAYPNGMYNHNTITLMKEAGFEYACTSKEMRTSNYVSDYKIPRYQVCNWNKEAFINQLKQW